MTIDVCSIETAKLIAEEVTGRFGEVTLLANCAGVAGSSELSARVEAWRWVIDVNLLGTVRMVRACMPLLLDSAAEAHVMNAASIAGLPSFGAGPYPGSKHAVIEFTDGFRDELAGTNVGVSVLYLGPVATSLAPNCVALAPGGAAVEWAQGASVEWMAPKDVATQTLNSMARGRFWMLTQPASFDRVEAQFDEMRWVVRGPGGGE